jgi:signal recognition particle subunit SRP54
MGDVLSLIERVEATVDAEQAQKFEQKLRNRSFDLEDFAMQLEQVTKMGPLDQLLDMFPGMAQIKRAGPIEIDQQRFTHIRAIC